MPKKVVSVYFNGADDHNYVPQYESIALAVLLDQITVVDDSHLSICVNGCDVGARDARDVGAIFGCYFEDQILTIARQVEEMVKSTEEGIILNVYGFGRGGVAAFGLCQKLKNISENRLMINVVSFEPIPGDSIVWAYGDILLGTNSTLSATVADLTECKNIANMLVLFANKSLLDGNCHAPILPAFPSTCKVEVDVTPGCHKGAVAFFKEMSLVYPENVESFIVFHRVVEFMQKSGTSFDFDKLRLHPVLKYLAQPEQDSTTGKLIQCHSDLIFKTFLHDADRFRFMHLQNSIFTSSRHKFYLNRYHQTLSNIEPKDENCMLTIENRNPQRITPVRRRAIQLTQLVFILAMTWMIYNKYFSEPSAECSNRLRP